MRECRIIVFSYNGKKSMSILENLKYAWTKYLNDELILVEASALVGVLPKQFLAVGRRLTYPEVNIPYDLMLKVDEQEYALLRLLHARQIGLLVEMLEREFVFPKRKAFITMLWEDLHLLEAFSLVKSKKGSHIWVYKLNLRNNRLVS